MFDVDKWQEIIHALKQNKLRTFLTAFGVFWGIFMLVVMLGSGRGLENGVYSEMGDFATNSMFVWSQRTSMPYKGFKRGRRFNFNNSDTRAIRQQIADIELLAPRLQAYGSDGQNNVIYGKKTGAFTIFGDYPDFNHIDPVTITGGRFINDIDIDQERKVAVIGQRVKEMLFENQENPIGKYIRIQGVYFQIVGSFRSMHTGGWGEWQDQCIFMPFTTLQKTYNYGDAVGWFSVTSKPNVSVSEVEKQVIALLKKRHDVHPLDDQAIGHENVEEQFNKINGLFRGIDLLIWIVGIGTLLAGVIGVSNIMLVIVRERTKEIGIQRAIGATPLKIMGQIVTESVFLTSIAGYIGLVLGVVLVDFGLSGIKTESFLNPSVNMQVAVTALAILVVSGALAGIIPARRAVRIKPIDALRFE